MTDHPPTIKMVLQSVCDAHTRLIADPTTPNPLTRLWVAARQNMLLQLVAATDKLPALLYPLYVELIALSVISLTIEATESANVAARAKCAIAGAS